MHTAPRPATLRPRRRPLDGAAGTGRQGRDHWFEGGRGTGSGPARGTPEHESRRKPVGKPAPRRSELRRSEDYSGPSRRRRCRQCDWRVTVTPCPVRWPTRCADRDAARVTDDLLDGLDADPARGRHRRRRAAGDPGRRRLGQDARPRPAASPGRRSTAHIDPEHVLAVTFTRKAAGELVGRLGRLGVRRHVTAGTFHCHRAGPAPAALAPTATGRCRQCSTRKARILAPMLPGKGAAAAARGSEVAARSSGRRPGWSGPTATRPPPTRRAASRPAPGRDRRRCTSATRRSGAAGGVVDFDDLIWWCADALETDAEFQAAQRWRFRHLFVDEFQDVNPAQFRLVRAWLGDRPDLCVVGDADQAIYGFAGADPSLPHRVRAPLPRRDRRAARHATTARRRRW